MTTENHSPADAPKKPRKGCGCLAALGTVFMLIMVGELGEMTSTAHEAQFQPAPTPSSPPATAQPARPLGPPGSSLAQNTPSAAAPAAPAPSRLQTPDSRLPAAAPAPPAVDPETLRKQQIAHARAEQHLYCWADLPIYERPDTTSPVVGQTYGLNAPRLIYWGFQDNWYSIMDPKGRITGYLPAQAGVFPKHWAGPPPELHLVREAIKKREPDRDSVEFDDPRITMTDYTDSQPSWFLRYPYRARNALGGMERRAFWSYYRHQQWLESGIE